MCSNNIKVNKIGGHENLGNSISGFKGHDHVDYESSSSRKMKKQRIPKRGPGVAELEKILREQEKIQGDVEKAKNNFYPPPFHYSSSASSSNSLPRNVTNFLGNSHLHVKDGNANANAYDVLKDSSQLGRGEILGSNGPSKGVYIGGSGIFLPEQTLLPITWSSSQSQTSKIDQPPKMAAHFFPLPCLNGSDPAKMFPPSMLQNNHGPSMIGLREFKEMNIFPQPAISTSSTPPPSSFAGVLYHHHVEPPSNQNPCPHYSSALPDEHDKLVLAKRLRPNNFPVDNWPPASSPLPCQPLLFHHQISRLDSASSSSNHGHVFDLGTASRDSMPSKGKTCIDIGNGSALITLGSSTTPLPSTTHQNGQPEFSKFINHYPFQEMKENNEELVFQRSSLSESDASSVQKKTFFSFLLQPEEQKSATEPTLCSKTEKHRTDQEGEGGDFIDLNLKL